MRLWMAAHVQSGCSTGGVQSGDVPAGNRGWRFKYRFAGQEKRISLGVYPDVGFKQARDRREDVRRQVAAGIDPSYARKLAKMMIIEGSENTFEVIAREWYTKQSLGWEASYFSNLLTRLESNVFPWLGRWPIRDVKAPELLSVLRRVPVFDNHTGVYAKHVEFEDKATLMLVVCQALQIEDNSHLRFADDSQDSLLVGAGRLPSKHPTMTLLRESCSSSFHTTAMHKISENEKGMSFFTVIPGRIDMHRLVIEKILQARRS